MNEKSLFSISVVSVWLCRAQAYSLRWEDGRAGGLDEMSDEGSVGQRAGDSCSVGAMRNACRITGIASSSSSRRISSLSII